jgi:hypothetical protein
MMLRPGSIEWGSKRSTLEKFNYALRYIQYQEITLSLLHTLHNRLYFIAFGEFGLQGYALLMSCLLGINLQHSIVLRSLPG